MHAFSIGGTNNNFWEYLLNIPNVPVFEKHIRRKTYYGKYLRYIYIYLYRPANSKNITINIVILSKISFTIFHAMTMQEVC